MQNRFDFDNYLFRCSALGKIMTGIKIGLTEKQEEIFQNYDKRYKGIGKELTANQLADYFEKGDKKYGRKVGLSTTTKTYLKSLHKEALMRRNKNITSKYLEKGIRVEEKSLTLFSDVTKELFVKNQIRFKDDFKTGEPDSKHQFIDDIKSSWDYETFPFYEDEIPNTDYDWQLQGYMDLTGIKKARLVYCLVDTPFSMITDTLRRMDWAHNIFNNDGDVREVSIPLVVETVSNMIYTEDGLKEFCGESTNIKLEWFIGNFFEIPKKDRVKIFNINYDKNKITALHNQIKLCREFLNNLTQIKIKELAA